MSEHIDIDHELITIRHYLHAHPERSFREFGTSIYLTDQLKAYGIEILHNPLETGVVGSFRRGRSRAAYRAARRHRRPAHRGRLRTGVQLRQ